MGGLGGYWSAISHLSQTVKMGVRRKLAGNMEAARTRQKQIRAVPLPKTSKAGSSVNVDAPCAPSST